MDLIPPELGAGSWLCLIDRHACGDDGGSGNGGDGSSA